MNTKIFTVIAALTMLIAACAPSAGASPASTETPTPASTSAASVESVDVQILESMPIQVRVLVRGQLPDAGCTSIVSVNQVREGNTFFITLVTTADPLALCAQMLTPFEQQVPLDTSDLEPGQYTVDVHGTQSSFELPANDLAGFQARLVNALNARDFEQLRSVMSDSLMIAYWRSEGTSNTPDQAIEQLQLNLLNSSQPVVADESKDLSALLGMDPVTIAGPDVTEVSPLLVFGLGSEGKDEAILFSAKQADGSWYWHGLLFAKDGFENQ